ncbi:MAG: GntR family transcriptional regulator [Marinobacter sp.]|nr:GntR family transcriptional regulator [Marinobacter sp.]
MCALPVAIAAKTFSTPVNASARPIKASHDQPSELNRNGSRQMDRQISYSGPSPNASIWSPPTTEPLFCFGWNKKLLHTTLDPGLLKTQVTGINVYYCIQARRKSVIESKRRVGESVPRTAKMEVHDAVKQRILDAVYQSHEFIREARVAQELEVSRTPVREAFRS